MIRKLSVLASIAAVFTATQAYSDSVSTDVRIDASTYSNGSQNLYLCNDETGTPVLMTSCPDYEHQDLDVVHNPPHPPYGDTDQYGNLLDINGDPIVNSGQPPVDMNGNPIVMDGGRLSQQTPPNQPQIIAIPTAPVDGLGGPAPTYTIIDPTLSGGGTSFGDEGRSGGGGGAI